MSAHTREHHSLLAAPEKKALVWMATRLPAWVNSDHLTLIGLTSMIVAGLAFAAARWTPWTLPVVVAALAANWFGDSLDGTLARVRNRLRPRYGFYVDHVIDIVGAFFLLGGLALSGYMNPFVALGLLVAYLMVSAEVFLATHALGIFRMASFGFGPTELRLVLAAGTLYLFRDPHVNLGALGSYRLFDFGGAIAIAGMAIALVVSAIRNTRSLYLAETTR
jgi:phosphatidylglycerophosphate synthase